MAYGGGGGSLILLLLLLLIFFPCLASMVRKKNSYK